MELIYKSFFLFFGFQGMFLAISILMDRKSSPNLAKNILIGIIFLSSAIIFYDIQKFFGLLEKQGVNQYYANPFIYVLLGLAIYLFTRNGNRNRKNNLISLISHLTLLLIVLAAVKILQSSLVHETASKYLNLGEGTVYHLYITVFLVTYSILSYHETRKSTGKNTVSVNSTKLVVYVLYFTTAIFLFILPLNLSGMLGTEIALVNTVVLCTFIATFSFLSITKTDFPFFQDDFETPPKDHLRYGKSGLSTSLSLELKNTLEELMISEKLYLNHDLCLDNLAEKMHVSRHHASQIVNEHYSTGFNDFVNSYRIKEAEKLLKYDDSSVKEIAFLSGFNSRAAFYTAFKKFNGMSPVIYRKVNETKGSLLVS